MRTGRHLLFGFLAAAALAVADPAFAQSNEPPSWLLKYLSFYANVGGNPPNTSEPTVIRLYGWYPYDCGGIRDWGVIDSGHIRLKLVKASDICGDTTRTWFEDFDLGYLPLGDHTLTVTRTFVNAARTDSVTESASFSFPVIDLQNPPPPPPPPPGPQPPHWVVPWVTYGSTIPSQPNALEPTTLVLHGLFPYDCGEIVDVTSDSASVSFTMQPGPACGDTIRAWTQQFPLGTLSAGFHAIHVTRRFISPDSNAVAEGDLGFNVWPDPTHPPPVPPDSTPEYPSVLVRCLSGWSTTAPPTTHAPTTLVVWGWYPYLCGQVEAYLYDPHYLIINLRRNASGCGDTVVTWRQSVDLGVLPAGSYPITIELNVPNDPDQQASVSRHAQITLWVDDREVSASVPNPFVADTKFTVNLQRTEDIDVGIYDLHGRRVKTVFHGAAAPGARAFRWDGTREDGSRAAIGIYFSRVAFSNRVVTRKLVMLPR